jgi:HD-like signal output (HDOD) protein
MVAAGAGTGITPSAPVLTVPRREITDADREFAERIAQVVKAVIDSGKYKPPLLPEIAVTLSAIANKPEVPIEEVEVAVSRDPVVAAKIVSVANSALNARGAALSSLRGAITRLGIFQVRDIAFQVVAGTRLFRVPGYSERMKELFEASQAAGMLAREIYRARGEISEAAYLCGLLHDIGEAVILGIIGEASRVRGETPPSLSRIKIAVDGYHAWIGAWVCKQWKLSDTVTDAILDHHTPERSTDPMQMAYVLALADRLLAHAGIGTEWQPITKSAAPLFQALKLSPERAASLLRLAESLNSMRAEWALPSV